MFRKLILFSIKRPKTIMSIIAFLVIVTGSFLPRITIDTDPENMLSKKEFARVFHQAVKKEFSLYDFIILGIVREDHPDGVFTVETLNKIYRITEEIKHIEGIIAYELISPSTKDNIRQGGAGTVVFEWLMPELIESKEQALILREEIMDNPMFYGTMVSEDGRALCVYIPIKKKNTSYRISQEVRSIIAKYPGEENYYITGLPVAEDTFGIEMFKQMAISAPLAMLVIFILMFYFFRNLKLIISPLILAMVTVIVTMGILIGCGLPVHIMSSMIPIFLMPIAVLDSVHILSEFYDVYKRLGDKHKALIHVMDELFTPMLYTSITSAVGFFSLSFSRIPPVQTFGIFVALGIMTAWMLTMTFIPAYISLMGDDAFKSFHTSKASNIGVMNRILQIIGNLSTRHYKIVLAGAGIFIIISVFGILKIRVNDNPVKWFTKSHPIRIADKVLNSHFGGTYTAYLVIEAENKKGHIFKEPLMLSYIERMQKYLVDQGNVGKITSLADVVKKVYYELLGGDKIFNVIPETKRAVSQCLISYENSHKPDDLWHLTTPDFSKVNLWVQLKSGDNKNMETVINQVNAFIKEHQPPFNITHGWAGLTYINVVWQNKMVVGMLMNFLGSFIIVLFIMTFLFKSFLRGIISLIPLSISILFIYSLLGYIGRDYDMPVAVLSALTLGLSIDFAIHFIQRARTVYRNVHTWEATSRIMFNEPGRAIMRNTLIIAIGFLPLLAAPLIPYKTVGFFMFMIMMVSGISTLVLLPSIITAFPGIVFNEKKWFGS